MAFQFYEYQNRFMKDGSRFRALNKSRQIGFSFLIAYEAVKKAQFGRNVLLCSSSQRQSNELNRKCKRWINALKVKMPKLNWKLATDTKEELGFEKSGTIFCLPSNPNTTRGFTGDVYLDEFALHKDQHLIYESLVPTITRGGTITIISTPLGQSDLFHQIFTNHAQYPDFLRYQIDIYEAIKQGFDIDIELIKRNMDEESFNQEYLCQFIDESTAYFTFDLIKSCVGETELHEAEIKASSHYIGVDIGRKHDLTAIYVLRQLGKRFFTAEIQIMKNAKFSEQQALIENLYHKYQARYVKIDATGIGANIAENLSQKYSNIEGVEFTNKNKERIAINLKKAFEDKQIEIPDDRNLINDIHSIKKSITKNNLIRFDAERDETGHADRFWALGLAYDCLVRESIDFNPSDLDSLTLPSLAANY